MKTLLAKWRGRISNRIGWFFFSHRYQLALWVYWVAHILDVISEGPAVEGFICHSCDNPRAKCDEAAEFLCLYCAQAAGVEMPYPLGEVDSLGCSWASD